MKPYSQVQRTAGILLIAMAVLLGITDASLAASYTWTNAVTGNSNWGSTANWSPGVAPAAGGASDATIVFFSDTTTPLSTGAAIGATNNLGSGLPSSFLLNILTLNGLGPVAGNRTVTISGADLVFTNNAGLLPVVNLNGSNNTASLSYQITSNLKLTDNTTFQGNGTAPVTISGVISGAGSLTKTNTARLILTGTNTYTGATIIQKGSGSDSAPAVLEANDRAGLSSASNLQFAGGVLQSTGTSPVSFTRSLGTGSNQVQWLTGRDGGFAANGAKLTVNIGGNSTPLTLVWNSPNFVGPNRVLLFGSSTATAEVELKNNLDLAGVNQVIVVNDNPNSGGDFATISGVVTNGALEKQNGGTLKLTGVNKYTGTTAINGGALEAIDGIGLPTASYLQLGNGGVLQSSGTFSRSLGASGAGKVGWIGPGGFAAAGGKLTVALAGVPGALVWGSTANFVPTGQNLVFGSTTADSEVEFTDNIDLNEAARIIQVTDNPFTNTDIATISGVISSLTSAGSLTINGGGTLRLTGTNTYSGATSIQQGVLEAKDGVGLPTASNLRLNSNAGISGVFQSSGTFTRSLGTGADQVQWVAARSAGFSAADSKFTVNIGGDVTPDTLVWGSTANFISSGQTLTFGSDTSMAELEFQNNINLNSATQTIQVNDNPSSSADFTTISGQLSNGGLTKTGAGTLILSANNNYTGTTTVNAGSLLINGGLTTGGAGVFVNAGATLGGTGTINRAVTVASGATLSPGAASGAGALKFTSSLTLSNAFTYHWDLGTTSTDRLDVAALTLASGFTSWTLQLGVEGNPPALFSGITATNNVFVLMQATSGSLPVALTNNFLLVPGVWATSPDTQVYFNNDHTQLLLTGVYLVPEPHVVLLVLFGGLTIVVARRRQRGKLS